MESHIPGVYPTGSLPAQVELSRSTASASLNPSKAWSTMTLAITLPRCLSSPHRFAVEICEVVVAEEPLSVSANSL